MRISYLTSTVLAICLLPLSTTAFASCSSASCTSSGKTTTYGSGSYGALSTSSKYRASSHNSSGINTRYGLANIAAFASGSVYRSTYATTDKVVPFTTTVSKISNYRVAGMGSNEFLSPTTCPTNVYNPGGNKVLGCYSVVKPVQVVRPVPQIHYQQIRVVHPIIYVRYPVPTPLPVPVCRSQALVCGSGCSGVNYSRYGNTLPRLSNNCRSW